MTSNASLDHIRNSRWILYGAEPTVLQPGSNITMLIIIHKFIQSLEKCVNGFIDERLKLGQGAH